MRSDDEQVNEIEDLRAEVERLRTELALEAELVTLHAGGASRAEFECATLREEVERLRAHEEYHRTEDPHALEAALRRCSDLASQCRALSEDVGRLRAELKIAWDDEAEAECAALRAEVERLLAERDAANKQAEIQAESLRAACAEVERLREESATRLAYSEQWRTEALAGRARLAAATAEIERLRAALDQDIETRNATVDSLAAAIELVKEAAQYVPGLVFERKVQALLAAQPAAPVRFAYVDGDDAESVGRLRANGFVPVVLRPTVGKP